MMIEIYGDEVVGTNAGHVIFESSVTGFPTVPSVEVPSVPKVPSVPPSPGYEAVIFSY